MESQNRNLTERVTLRLPDGMRTAIKIEAAKNRRSVNSELIHCLEQTYEPYQGETENK